MARQNLRCGVQCACRLCPCSCTRRNSDAESARTLLVREAEITHKECRRQSCGVIQLPWKRRRSRRVHCRHANHNESHGLAHLVYNNNKKNNSPEQLRAVKMAIESTYPQPFYDDLAADTASVNQWCKETVQTIWHITMAARWWTKWWTRGRIVFSALMLFLSSMALPSISPFALIHKLSVWCSAGTYMNSRWDVIRKDEWQMSLPN